MATPTDEIWVQEGDIRRKLEGKELNAFIAHREQLIAKEAAELKAAEDAKKAKEALLERIGITEEEAKLLLS